MEPVAVRNRLRNEVFPLLAEISGRDAVPPLVRCAADAALREDGQADALDQAKLLDPQGRLHLAALRKLTPDLQRAGLRDFLMRAGIPSLDRALLERALGLVDPANPAAINLPGGKRLRRRAGRIWNSMVRPEGCQGDRIVVTGGSGRRFQPLRTKRKGLQQADGTRHNCAFSAGDQVP